jgi:hypothetical protein
VDVVAANLSDNESAFASSKDLLFNGFLSFQVLALDAATGEVYEPDLEAMLQDRKDKQCAFRVTDTGFSSDKNVVILVRAKFFTARKVDETESDVPAAKHCGDNEETWSFNYATGEVRQVGNAEPFHLFKKFVPNRQAKLKKQHTKNIEKDIPRSHPNVLRLNLGTFSVPPNLGRGAHVPL